MLLLLVPKKSRQKRALGLWYLAPMQLSFFIVLSSSCGHDTLWRIYLCATRKITHSISLLLIGISLLVKFYNGIRALRVKDARLLLRLPDLFLGF